MTPDSLLREIVATASSIRPIGMVRGYVFGSVVRPNFCWTDVDILVVCDNPLDVPYVRSALTAICNAAPIDLLLMSSAEEAQLNFVSEQGCQALFELSAELCAGENST